MANWREYTTKTKPEDTDEIMIADTKENANKRTLFSGLWNWIADKLATAVISQLETQNKSIIPALNELSSNTLPIFKEFTITLNSNVSKFADGNGCNNGANMCVYSNLLHIISLNLNILNSTSDYIFTIDKKEHFPKNNVRLIFTSESGAVNAMPFIQSADGTVKCDGTIPYGKVKIMVIYMTNQ